MGLLAIQPKKSGLLAAAGVTVPQNYEGTLGDLSQLSVPTFGVKTSTQAYPSSTTPNIDPLGAVAGLFPGAVKLAQGDLAGYKEGFINNPLNKPLIVKVGASTIDPITGKPTVTIKNVVDTEAFNALGNAVFGFINPVFSTEKFLTSLVKVGTEDAAVNLFTKSGVPEDIARLFARPAVGVKTPEAARVLATEIDSALSKLQSGAAQGLSKPAGTSGLLQGTGRLREILPSSEVAPSLTPSEVSLTKIKIDPEISQYINEQIKAREAARGVDDSIWDKTKDFLATTKAKLVDFTSPIEDTLTTAMARDKYSLLPSDDITNAIDRALRAPTIAGQFAKDHGIIDVIKTAPDVHALDQYLIAKHAIELDTAGITTGRDLVKDEKLVSSLAPVYEPFAKKVGEYSRNLLQYAVDSGLISQELANSLKAKYPDYVPFNRVFAEGEIPAGATGSGKGIASQGSQTAVRKIKGSERQVESPLESFLSKTNEIFIQGERNKAARLLASYEKLKGNPFQLKELKAMKDVETGRSIKLPGDESKTTISFMDKGVKRTFSTTPEIATAAKALSVQQLNILVRILALPVRIARLGITGINLPFIAANLAKDQVTAFINSSRALKTSIANPKNFIASLFSAVGHGELYKDMIRAGGGGTSFDIARNQVVDTVKSVRASRSVPSKIAYTITHPGDLLRAVENIVNRGEEATRIQQFRGTREVLMKEGMSREEATVAAARAARENTVNFMRRGEWGTVLNSTILYLNANIQGTRTFLRALKARPAQTALKLAVVGFTPVAYATFWNLSDEKRAAVYKDISSYEKENNIILVFGDAKDEDGKYTQVVKIPLSQEINNVVGLVRRPIEAMFGMDPVSMKDVATALIGAVSPVKPDAGSVLSTLTPQAIRPTLEGAVNQSLFTGIPQVPQSLEGLSPKNQAKPNTSGTARLIGDQLNISPIKVQEWIKSTFGGFGAQALHEIDSVLAATKLIPKEQISGQNILDSIAARFNRASGGETSRKAQDEITAFTQADADKNKALLDKATSIWNSMKGLPAVDAKAKLKEAVGTDEALLKKVIDVGQADKLGLQGEEKRLKTSSVEVRASFIYLHMNQMKDDAAKKSYLQDLVKKKILTPDVIKQMVEIKKQDTTKPSATSSPQAMDGKGMAEVLASLTGAPKAEAASSEPASTALPGGMVPQPRSIGDYFAGRTELVRPGEGMGAPVSDVATRVTKGIVGVENEGALARGEDFYKIVGVTGDLGKYQASPQTVANWSKSWLGKKYTSQQFLSDPKAQEEFFKQYLAVVDRYKLTPEEAAIAWHVGWGQLGIGPVDTRESRFRAFLSKAMQTPENKRYLQKFSTYANS